MNAVKIVGGLIEIGAAFKFINTAEIGFGDVPEDAWFDAQVVLSIWVVLAAVCGVYLLGLFRTDHDHEEVKVGPGRILTGSLFLGHRAVPGPRPLRPAAARARSGTPSSACSRPTSASSSARPRSPAGPGDGPRLPRRSRPRRHDPRRPSARRRASTASQWGLSLEAAQRAGQGRGQADPDRLHRASTAPIAGRWSRASSRCPRSSRCSTSSSPSSSTPTSSRSARSSKSDREDLAAKNQELILDMASEATNPFYVALTPDGSVLNTIGG